MSDFNGIPEGWKYKNIGDIGYVITGKTPSRNNPEDWGDKLDFITPSEVSSKMKYISETPRKLSNIGINRFLRMILPKNSILVTCIGSDMGKVILNKNKALTNQQINSIVTNKNYDFQFVYYLLKNGYKILRRNAEGSGSTMPLLNKSSFESLNFNIPSNIEEQKSIAVVLTSFDNKIELLQSQNKTLETIAQTIFKEWFGKYQIGDELPEGWKVETLGRLGTVITGKTPNKNNPEYWGSNYDFVTPSDFKNFGLYSDKCQRGLSNIGWKKMQKKQLPLNTIMVTCIGSDMGKVAISQEECITNQQLNSIILTNSFHTGFVYEFLKSQYTKLRTIAMGGSTMPIINKTDFSNIKLLVPTELLSKKYNQIWKGLSQKIFYNQKQIQTLTKTRDTLLPKLMSGQIRVNDLNKSKN